MIQRCHNPKDKGYRFYGAKGVQVCERWRTSLDAFMADMGERPHGKSLDRFPDPAGNYEPGNVRWATAMEQRHNQRADSKRKPGLTAFGKTQSMIEWAKEYGMNRNTLATRLNRGWPIEQALTEPSRNPLLNVTIAPTEPTDEMVRAGAEAIATASTIDAPKLPAPAWDGTARRIYKAMLEAL